MFEEEIKTHDMLTLPKIVLNTGIHNEACGCPCLQ